MRRRTEGEDAAAVQAGLVHLVPIGFLCAGLLRAGRLAGVEQPACQCAGACRCGCQGEDDQGGEDQDPTPRPVESVLR